MKVPSRKIVCAMERSFNRLLLKNRKNDSSEFFGKYSPVSFCRKIIQSVSCTEVTRMPTMAQERYSEELGEPVKDMLFLLRRSTTSLSPNRV